MTTKIPKLGSRVRIKSVNIKGRVFYIHTPDLYADHMHPVQVELDKPYDDSGQTMYRTNLHDLVVLKKATKKKAATAPSHGIQVGTMHKLSVKKKDTYVTRTVNILSASEEELTYQVDGKKKTVTLSVSTFMKQKERADKKRKPKKEKVFDAEEMVF
jgi:hypothetical protein